MLHDWDDARTSSLDGAFRVLVVEPSARERARLVEALSAAGLVVLEAGGAVAAEAVWSSGAPRADVVWARWDDPQGGDQLAPGSSMGLELLASAKADPAMRTVPVVLYASAAAEAERAAAYDAGAADFLAPALTGEALVARVRAAARDGRALALLEHRAYHDALTGLLNRGAVADQLMRSAALCQRRQAPLSFLFIDLDHFKKINDEHGHARGDAALVRVASVLRRCLRASDLAARLGGDEFLVAAVECPPDQAPALAWRILKELAGDRAEPIGVSVGVAGTFDMTAEGLDAALDRADRALAHAKRAGRRTVAEFREGQDGPAPAAPR